MKREILFSTALLALTACGGDHQETGISAPTAESYYAEDLDMAPSGLVQVSEDYAQKMSQPMPTPTPTPGGDGGAIPETGPMLAFTHDRSIESPLREIETVVQSHKAQCEKAGFKTCMIVNSSQSGIGEEWASARLHIRATPEWIDKFFNELPSELEKNDSRITSSNTSAEDLSTRIIDTDARLKAKVTLRDRLQALLTDRPSELGDLVELERELSRVQADIDANASLLAALKQRVAMSNLYLNYSVKQTAVSRSVWAPLGEAFGDFFSNFAKALAAIVTFIAVFLPWIPIIGGLIWLGRWFFRRYKSQKAKAAEASTKAEA